MKPGNLFIALLHHPVYNRHGIVVTTSIANMDIHDLARAGKTYGVEKCYIVTPVAAQQELAAAIVAHWRDGYGAAYNPCRRDAFAVLAICASLADARAHAAGIAGREVKLAVTSASPAGALTSCQTLRERLDAGEAVLLAIGTGWGIAAEVSAAADYRLEALRGPGDYNHLSARCAAAIVLDRLCGVRRAR